MAAELLRASARIVQAHANRRVRLLLHRHTGIPHSVIILTSFLPSRRQLYSVVVCTLAEMKTIIPKNWHKVTVESSVHSEKKYSCFHNQNVFVGTLCSESWAVITEVLIDRSKVSVAMIEFDHAAAPAAPAAPLLIRSSGRSDVDEARVPVPGQAWRITWQQRASWRR